MKARDLSDFVKAKNCTLVGIGPVSLNCIDATIEIANEYSVPIMLIASRRQVDSVDFGGGYTNNWDTETFAKYVRKKDIGNYVLLCRDHGGPWQNEKEVDTKLDLEAAMDSAKKSFQCDIEAGFDILHIDPSIDIFGSPSPNQILSRAFELFGFCNETASSLGKELKYEVGTEEQTGGSHTLEELSENLNSISNFCSNNNIKFPTFVVCQAGTKVMETRNIGSFNSLTNIEKGVFDILQIPQIVNMCNKFSTMMKVHNADYLPNEALSLYPRLGVHAINVAPEFGVVESRALLSLLRMNSLDLYADSFLELAYVSNKWKKWMLTNTDANMEERAIIAGHYVFSSEAFLQLYSSASKDLKIKGIDLQASLKHKVKESILNYLKNLNMLN